MPVFETIAVDLEKLKSVAKEHWGVEVGTCLKSSQNHTYETTDSNGDKFILRATPDPKGVRADPTELEVKLLDYLFENGMTVCPSIKSKVSGSSIVLMDQVILCLFHYAKGEKIVYQEWKWMHEKDIVVSLGKWFGQLHQLVRSFQKEQPELCSKARHWTTVHDSILATYPVDPLDTAVNNDPLHYGIIHGDVNPTNYFWQPESKLISMFDWDQLQTCYYMYDLSSPIWGVVSLQKHGSTVPSEHPPNADAKLYTQWLLEGYEPICGPIDKPRLERMVMLRRELYIRVCKRVVDSKELPEDHMMYKFCKQMVDLFEVETDKNCHIF